MVSGTLFDSKKLIAMLDLIAKFTFWGMSFVWPIEVGADDIPSRLASLAADEPAQAGRSLITSPVAAHGIAPRIGRSNCQRVSSDSRR